MFLTLLQAADVPDAPSAPSAFTSARRRAHGGWHAARNSVQLAARAALEALTHLYLGLHAVLAWLAQRLRLAGTFSGVAVARVQAAAAHGIAAVGHGAAAVRARLPHGGPAGA